MFVAYIGAMDVEVDAIIKSLKDVKKEEYRGFSFYVGKRGDNTIAVSTSGIGKVNAAVTATVLLDKYHVDYVINAGIAGSVDTLIGTICVADILKYHDVYCPGYEGLPRGPKDFRPSAQILSQAKTILKDKVLFGTFLSGDQFIEKVADLHNASLNGVVAVDMESAAIAQVCYLFSTDFLIIRTISDNLSNKEATENENEASKNSFNAVVNFIDNYKF